jgi:hypothetical protein
MYMALKAAVPPLCPRLKGSGMAIEHAGYRKGYRLVINDVENERDARS